ncbi:MAG TPA: flavin reductase family protein [Pirellulales bacterium]|jgi:flavin reductase (DIM6/NTAB) family NADH-FMN oxidoreductase RutF|nr:flavin reductase family protein [Pirellulales bacterium]
MPFDSKLQRRIMGQFATGVTVITTRRGGEICGMTANAVASLSLEPPLVLAAVDKRAQMHKHLSEARAFAMNILSDQQEALSQRFAARGPKEMGDLTLTTAVTGAPILADALAYVDCKLVEILPGGDHDIFIGEIVAGDVREGKPLLFYGGKYAAVAE